jgi:flagellar assembly protein FliH
VLRGVTVPASGLGALEAELPLVDVTGPLAPEVEVQRSAEAGFQRGYQEGLAEGRAAGAAEAAAACARLERAARALAAAAAELAARQALELVGLEDDLAGAALELAAAVVGRELDVAAFPGADALARALSLAPAGVVAVARLHPDDAASVDPATVDGDVDAGRLRIVADPGVERGGCVLEAGDCRIDAQLGPALARARAVLRGEGGAG